MLTDLDLARRALWQRWLGEWMNMLVGPWDDINCPYDPIEHRYYCRQPWPGPIGFGLDN